MKNPVTKKLQNMAHSCKQNRTNPLIKHLHWHNPKQKQTGLLPARPDGQTAALKPSSEVSFNRARGQVRFDWRAANVINEIGVVAALWEPIDSALISHPRRTGRGWAKTGKTYVSWPKNSAACLTCFSFTSTQTHTTMRGGMGTGHSSRNLKEAFNLNTANIKALWYSSTKMPMSKGSGRPCPHVFAYF